MRSDDLQTTGDDIEAIASQQERELEQRATSKRMLYVDNVRDYKARVESALAELGYDNPNVSLYGNEYDAAKDILQVSYEPKQEQGEGDEDKVVDVIVDSLLASKLNKYFNPDFVGTPVDPNNRTHIFFLKWDHTWKQFKKDDIDFIEPPADDAGGGGFM